MHPLSEELLIASVQSSKATPSQDRILNSSFADDMAFVFNGDVFEL